MARTAPILGYPTQALACAALQDQGHSPEEIGRAIGRDANHVRASLRRLRAPPKPRTFALPRQLAFGLADAAEARGMTVAELTAELLDIVIRDDLVDVLLGEPGGALRQAQDEQEMVA